MAVIAFLLLEPAGSKAVFRAELLPLPYHLLGNIENSHHPRLLTQRVSTAMLTATKRASTRPKIDLKSQLN
jgi:hypothetical protein